MTRRSGYALITALAAVIVLVATALFLGVGTPVQAPATAVPQPRASAAAPAIAGAWVGTWAAAPVAAEPHTPHGYPGMSIRNVVHTTVSGTAARVQLSNLFGTVPLVLTHVSLGIAADPSSPGAEPQTITALDFSGRPAVTIPAGRSVLSDPVRFEVPAAGDLLVTTYTPYASGPVTYHPNARQVSFAAAGDHTADPAGTAFTSTTPYWRYVTGVDVWTTDATSAVVAFGDSITDGITSTFGADHRWPDFLAGRLHESTGGPHLSVLNEGVSGNRVLLDGAPADPDNGERALDRMGRDVLSRAGVKAVIVELGINDIIQSPHQTDAAEIVAGLQEITREAHAHGIRVIGATLTPFHGQRSWTPRLEEVRQQVNTAIRGGRVFDDVVDFDLTLRDPRMPDRLLPAFDSGDHLHPTDAGYEAMAQAVDLGSLLGGAPATV